MRKLLFNNFGNIEKTAMMLAIAACGGFVCLVGHYFFELPANFLTLIFLLVAVYDAYTTVIDGRTFSLPKIKSFLIRYNDTVAFFGKIGINGQSVFDDNKGIIVNSQTKDCDKGVFPMSEGKRYTVLAEDKIYAVPVSDIYKIF